MKEVLGDLEAMSRGAAADILRVVKKSVTNRKAIVAVMTYALRAALDDLSPDERSVWLQLALDEVRR